MSGSIFVVDDKNRISELKESKFQSEDIFQELIERYPNILAGDQITPENPRKWIFISREIGVPDKEDGSNRWYLDHLFIDQDAIPTFVEVKRSTDTRIRREVVAQMLDYAANATEYWDVDTIKDLYEKQNKRIHEDLEIDLDSEDLFWTNVKNNLKIGKIRLLFVADEIPLPLKRIIEFLNSQMMETEVLGLEIKQFISDKNLKTFVPRIVGQTSNTVQSKNNSSWSEESFLRAVENVDDELVEICQDIICKFKELECRIYLGQGKSSPSMVPIYEGKQRNQLFAVYAYKSSVKMEIYFQYYKMPYFDDVKKKEMQNKLSEILNFNIQNVHLDKRPSVFVDVLKDTEKREAFLKYFEGIVKALKNCDEM